jgi:hypothetical protein
VDKEANGDQNKTTSRDQASEIDTPGSSVLDKLKQHCEASEFLQSSRPQARLAEE